MSKLKEKLQDYKDITLQLVSCLKAEYYDTLDELLNKRQDIIYEIDKLSYKREEFKSICDELDIEVLEKKLNALMVENSNRVKESLKKAIEGKNVNRSYRPGYNKNSYVDSLYISKKV